jgi:hypothetical protein
VLAGKAEPLCDSVLVDVDVETTFLVRRKAVMNGWRIAACGFMRRSGSHNKHFATKSTKSSSSQRSTWLSVFAPGLRRLPLELTTGLGAPVESSPVVSQVLCCKILDVPKNSRLRELRLISSFSGGPSTSMMQESCSCSFSPGKIGNPVYSSANMHPRLHMSMAMW